MVQRRLKSEVWLRDVLNKQISVAENYAIFACVLLLSYLLLGHRFVHFFLKFRLNIILFERMNNMKDFDDVTLAREDKELNDDEVSTIGGLFLMSLRTQRDGVSIIKD